jgi:ankyrin repeat protein
MRVAESGSSVDIANNKGCTILREAASNGNVNIVRELLNHGACVDIPNNKGLYTP